MFAVLKTGGKQYRVQAGDVLRIEKLHAEAGDTVQFDEILMLGGDTAVIGTPFVKDAAVQATVIDQVKGEKVISFVKRRRKHSSKRTRGHRQQLTLVRVTEILAEGAGKSGATSAKAAASAEAAPAKGKKAAKPAEAKSAEAESAGTGRRPENLLEKARNDKADDLKKITGVGPKLEGLLHENGVFHFDQIAAWDQDEVDYMNDQLSFKGRIERDSWIEQAARFAAEEE